MKVKVLKPFIRGNASYKEGDKPEIDPEHFAYLAGQGLVEEASDEPETPAAEQSPAEEPKAKEADEPETPAKPRKKHKGKK